MCVDLAVYDHMSFVNFLPLASSSAHGTFVFPLKSFIDYSVDNVGSEIYLISYIL